jgi:hypothetical protein
LSGQLLAAALTRQETAIDRTPAAASLPAVFEIDRQPWLTGTEELTAAGAADEVFVLSRPRRLALCAVVGVALLLLIAPLVLAALPVLDSRSLDRTSAQLEQVSRIASLLQLGRLPLFLAMAAWVAWSPKEQ